MNDDWKNLVTVETVDEDTYDYALFLRNVSQSRVKVVFTPLYSMGDGFQETRVLAPEESQFLGYVDSGPAIDIITGCRIDWAEVL